MEAHEQSHLHTTRFCTEPCRSDLRKLYDELVRKGVVTEEEFWSNKARTTMLDDEANKAGEQKKGLSTGLSEPDLEGPHINHTSLVKDLVFEDVLIP